MLFFKKIDIFLVSSRRRSMIFWTVKTRHIIQLTSCERKIKLSCKIPALQSTYPKVFASFILCHLYICPFRRHFLYRKSRITSSLLRDILWYRGNCMCCSCSTLFTSISQREFQQWYGQNNLVLPKGLISEKLLCCFYYWLRSCSRTHLKFS